MKKIKQIALFAFALIALTACADRYAEPPYNEPSYEVPFGKQLITIADLKNLHVIGEAPDQIPINYVIKGIVVADDESGNVYKSIYIQDETGGVNLSINQVNLYNIMPRGQELFVEAGGLWIGDYVRAPQVGDTVTDPEYGLEISRYDWVNESAFDKDGESTQRFFPNGLPDLSNVPAPKIITSSNEITDDLYCSLVTLQGITMNDADGEMTWSTKEQNVNRTAKFADGSTITIRTSGYCNFYRDVVPSNEGNLTGILTVFNTTKQLTIRDRNDIDF